MSKKYDIGFIAGSFDIIHPGYIHMFKYAKEYCDYLLIGLHIDPTINNSNKIKPILSVDERKETLLSIKYIDNVILYATEEDLYNILSNRKINVRFLGDDYLGKEYTGMDIKELPVLFIPRGHGWSTTKFKNMIGQQLN